MERLVCMVLAKARVSYELGQQSQSVALSPEDCMRRSHALVITTALALGLAPQASAQVEIGVKAGVTFATISESNLSPNFESKTGFAAGVHFGFPLGSNFMLQPEAPDYPAGRQVHVPRRGQ